MRRHKHTRPDFARVAGESLGAAKRKLSLSRRSSCQLASSLTLGRPLDGQTDGRDRGRTITILRPPSDWPAAAIVFLSPRLACKCQHRVPSFARSFVRSLSRPSFRSTRALRRADVGRARFGGGRSNFRPALEMMDSQSAPRPESTKVAAAAAAGGSALRLFGCGSSEQFDRSLDRHRRIASSGRATLEAAQLVRLLDEQLARDEEKKVVWISFGKL